MHSARTVGAALAALTLTGCAGGASLLSDSAPAGQDLDMAGRWVLSAPNAPTCGLSLTGVSGKNEGSIVPEGGCPERFFTSRRWRLDNSALSILDGENNALATLNFTAGRFEGKSDAGTPLTLSR